MTSSTKRGFHLPWTGDDRAASVDADADSDGDPATNAPTAGSGLRGAAADDLGSGPFGLRSQSPADRDADARSTADPASDSLVDNDEVVNRMPDMAVQDPKMAWPDVDRAGSATHRASDGTLPPGRPPVVVEGDSNGTAASTRSSRRDNPLVVGLVRAMRDAARATREETTARMRADAAARVDEIRNAGATEAVALRKRADDDVAGIGEWSKAEMTRIREEAARRVADRRTELASEAEAHEAEIERLVEQVNETAATFETEMDQFFEVLLAEEDPARLATLAEQVPDAPEFGNLPAPAATEEAGAARANGSSRGRRTSARSGEVAAESPDEPASPDDAPSRLEPDAAAAAEAEAIAGLDDEPGPTAPLGDSETQSRVVIRGLTSVAGISAFKSSLGRVPGVESVSVSSGTEDDFVFAVIHAATADLRHSIAEFAAFGPKLTADDGSTLAFAVTEPAR